LVKVALKEEKPEPRIIKANLDMNNPAKFDAKGKRFMEIQEDINSFLDNNPQADGFIINNLRDAVDNNLDEAVTHYMVREPEQIKILKGKEQFARDLAENSRIQNAIDKINNNPNKPLQELVYRNGEQVGYGDYFNYDDDAIYIDYLRNITKNTPNYQKGVGSEIVDKILQNNPNKNIIWDTVDDDAEAFKQAYLKKHPELTPYVFQQGDYDQLVALAKDQGYNINDYLELLREKSKKTGL
jgi:hypothetical protein